MKRLTSPKQDKCTNLCCFQPRLPVKSNACSTCSKEYFQNKSIPNVSEETIQKQVIAYCRMNNIEVIPSLNGIKMTAGMSKKYKSLGMERGVADLHFPMSNASYNSLWIELKKVGGKVSPEQKKFIERRNNDHNKAVICFGYNEAIAEINEYFNIKTYLNHVCHSQTNAKECIKR